VVVVIPPWMLGTVEPWSIWTLNSICIAVGVLAMLFKVINGDTSSPARARSDESQDNVGEKTGLIWKGRISQDCFLFCLTGLIPLFVFIHFLNARAEFNPQLLTFRFLEQCIQWLPHTYDRDLTFDLFWQCLSLWVFFWGFRSWLLSGSLFLNAKDLGNKSEESRLSTRGSRGERNLRRLLWVFVSNAALVSFVGILQRLDGTQDLLWLYHPKFQSWDIYSHFGPFGYRGNAATYLNLMWPVGAYLLGVELSSNHGGRKNRIGNGAYTLLYPLLFVISLGVIISSSRAGAIVLIASMGLLAMRAVFAAGKVNARLFAIFLGAAVLIAGIAWILDEARGLTRIISTAKELAGKGSEGRPDIYQHLPSLFREHFLWGSGPGSFSSVYVIVRKPTLSSQKEVVWSAWAHSDPAEILITFGVVGSILLLSCFFFILILPRLRGKPVAGQPGGFYLFLSLGTMVVHSFVDFPFQIHSLLHAFVVIVAIISAVQCDLGSRSVITEFETA
jgi:O-antigen ligase